MLERYLGHKYDAFFVFYELVQDQEQFNDMTKFYSIYVSLEPLNECIHGDGCSVADVIHCLVTDGC